MGSQWSSMGLQAAANKTAENSLNLLFHNLNLSKHVLFIKKCMICCFGAFGAQRDRARMQIKHSVENCKCEGGLGGKSQCHARLNCSHEFVPSLTELRNTPPTNSSIAIYV